MTEQNIKDIANRVENMNHKYYTNYTCDGFIKMAAKMNFLKDTSKVTFKMVKEEIDHIEEKLRADDEENTW